MSVYAIPIVYCCSLLFVALTKVEVDERNKVLISVQMLY
jgi:hypothetical protein